MADAMRGLPGKEGFPGQERLTYKLTNCQIHGWGRKERFVLLQRIYHKRQAYIVPICATYFSMAFLHINALPRYPPLITHSWSQVPTLLNTSSSSLTRQQIGFSWLRGVENRPTAAP